MPIAFFIKQRGTTTPPYLYDVFSYKKESITEGDEIETDCKRLIFTTFPFVQTKLLLIRSINAPAKAARIAKGSHAAILSFVFFSSSKVATSSPTFSDFENKTLFFAPTFANFSNLAARAKTAEAAKVQEKESILILYSIFVASFDISIFSPVLVLPFTISFNVYTPDLQKT